MSNSHRNTASVAEIDQVRTTVFSRNPDRPSGHFVRPRVTGDNRDVARARQRLRTAAWRADNDRRGRPSADQIGRALLMAVVTSPDFAYLLDSELSVVRRALNAMQANGFDLLEMQDVMRKIRRRHASVVDRDACDGGNPSACKNSA